jgi:hypothetical protein
MNSDSCASRFVGVTVTAAGQVSLTPGNRAPRCPSRSRDPRPLPARTPSAATGRAPCHGARAVAERPVVRMPPNRGDGSPPEAPEMPRHSVRALASSWLGSRGRGERPVPRRHLYRTRDCRQIAPRRSSRALIASIPPIQRDPIRDRDHHPARCHSTFHRILSRSLSRGHGQSASRGHGQSAPRR